MSFFNMRSFFCLLLAAFSLPAQTTPAASLRGVVTDPSGSVVPGAAIVLSSPQRVQKTEADERGAYQFSNVAAGVYTVSASAAGFSPFESAGYELTAGR